MSKKNDFTFNILQVTRDYFLLKVAFVIINPTMIELILYSYLLKLKQQPEAVIFKICYYLTAVVTNRYFVCTYSHFASITETLRT